MPAAANSESPTSGHTSESGSVHKESGAVEHEVDVVEAGADVKRQITFEDQTSRLPFRELVLIFIGLGFSLFLAFYDSTSVAVAFPAIAADLQAGQTISWVGTSYLIANNASQLCYSRISDIFGRKACMIFAILIFALGDLLCGFAKHPIQLYVFRALAGIGAGGITNLSMVIMSDVTSLRERSKWQGYIAGSVAMGSSAGPFIGAVLTSRVSWRWLFWVPVPCSLLCVALIWKVVPLKPVTGDVRSKLRKIDYAGCALSTAANVLTLFAISSGGSLYPWRSAPVIATLVVGTLMWAAFLLVEWKVAALPVMPLRLFTYRSPALCFAMSFMIGYVYYSNLFYLPLLFMVLQGKSSILAAAYLLSLLLVQTASGVTNGQISMRTGQVKWQIVVGFAIWLVGSGLETTFRQTTPGSKIVGFLLIQGIGVGCIIQTTLVAAQAGAPSRDRAVITGTRNFFRTFGGSFGLAISNAVLQNTLSSKLPTSLPDALRDTVIKNASLDLPETLDAATREASFAAYELGLKWIYVSFVPCVAICFVLSIFLKRDHLYDAAAPAPTTPLEDDACSKSSAPGELSSQDTHIAVDESAEQRSKRQTPVGDSEKGPVEKNCI